MRDVGAAAHASPSLSTTSEPGSARLLGRPAAPALAAAVGRASLDGRVAAQQRNPKSPK